MEPLETFGLCLLLVGMVFIYVVSPYLPTITAPTCCC